MDSSLASTLQQVNQSLALFAVSMLTVMYVVILCPKDLGVLMLPPNIALSSHSLFSLPPSLVTSTAAQPSRT